MPLRMIENNNNNNNSYDKQNNYDDNKNNFKSQILTLGIYMGSTEGAKQIILIIIVNTSSSSIIVVIVVVGLGVKCISSHAPSAILAW